MSIETAKDRNPTNDPQGSREYVIPEERRQIAEEARFFLSTIRELRTPVLCYRMNTLTEKYELFTRTMRGVVPFVAQKTNDDERTVMHFYNLGANIDTATGGEIEKLEKWGVDPQRVIVTKPVRLPQDLDSIARFKPRALVVEQPNDLEALAQAGIPNAHYSPDIIIRNMLPFGELACRHGAEVVNYVVDPQGKVHWTFDSTDPSSDSIEPADPKVLTPIRRILEKRLEIEERTGFQFGKNGLSVHVGGETSKGDKYGIAARIFGWTKQEMAKPYRQETGAKKLMPGAELSIFDFGGGYPDEEEPRKHGTTQEAVMEEIGRHIDRCRAKFPEVEMWAEPGRILYADSAFVLSRVTSVRPREVFVGNDRKAVIGPYNHIDTDNSFVLHYLGRFHEGHQIEIPRPDGSIKEIVEMKQFDFYPLRILEGLPPLSADSKLARLYGASCDSGDKLGIAHLPANIEIGDVVMSPCMGAYVEDLIIEKFNSLQRPQLLFFEHYAGKDPKVLLLEDVNPFDPEKYHHLLNIPRERLVTQLPPPLHTAALPVNTLSRVAGSLTDAVPTDLIRPAITTAANEDATVGLEFPLFDRNREGLKARDLHLGKALGIFPGGQSWVVKCNDYGLNRTVALKIGRYPADGAQGERSRAEAEKTANLKHRCFPEVYGLGVLPKDNNPYIVMEFIEGQTLSKLIPSLHTPTEQDTNWRNLSSERGKVLSRLADVASAIQYAHDNGVIHRDIKPDNIMCHPNIEEAVRVLDLGLNKAGGVDELFPEGEAIHPGMTRMGSVLGTVAYMSPEQARGEEVSEATDIWALGATLYEAITGQGPLTRHETFGGDPHDNSNRMLAALCRAEELGPDLIARPSTVKPNIPPELEAIVMKAMSIKPEDRYQSAAEISQDITNFLQKRPVTAHQETLNSLEAAWNTSKLFVQRKSREVAITATLLLAGGASLLGWNKYQEDQQEQRIAMERSDNIGSNAHEKLRIAKKYAEEGKLGEALGTLSTELIEQLSEYPIHHELLQDIEQHKQDWTTFQGFQDGRAKVYAELVPDIDLGTIRAVNIKGLGEVAKTYLPNGLTQEGIEALKNWLGNSKLTHEQKLQVLDGLIEWAYLDVESRYPDVIRFPQKKDERIKEAEAQVVLIEQLASVCDGTEKYSIQWAPAIASLRKSIALALGHEREAMDIESKGNSFGLGRASSRFLLSAVKFREKPDLDVLIGSGTTFLPLTLSIDPDHLAANILYSQVLYLKAVRATDGLDKRHYLNALVSSLEDCCRVDPNNPYSYGRIAIACQLAFHEIIKVSRDGDRVITSPNGRGIAAAKKCTELLAAKGIDTPLPVLDAQGELLIVMGDIEGASIVLDKAHLKDPSNIRVAVFKAHVDSQLGRHVEEESILLILTKVVNETESNWRVLPEAASVYCKLAAQASAKGDIGRADALTDSALLCLSRGIELNPQFKSFAVRVQDTFYPQLKNNARFQDLIR